MAAVRIAAILAALPVHDEQLSGKRLIRM